MKLKSKKILSAFSVIMAGVCILSCNAIYADETKPIPEAENVKVKQLYNGVTLTSFEVSKDSSYDINKFKIVEFDPKQSDLYIDVTNMSDYSNKLVTVMSTVEKFNANNGEGKTAIAAVNGDLWMVSYAHARVEGSGTSYGGYSDAVVTKSLTVPRGFNMYNGEIITTAHMTQETPYEGEFQSFGFSEDNEPFLGQPVVSIKSKNITKDTTKTVNGINRLPADNALVMYTDKGVLSNYSIAEAYEIVIDCDYDYIVKHGETIKGKITAICKEGDEDPQMKANRIILTARGSAEKKVKDYEIGDEIEISITVKDSYGNNEAWQTKVKNAVGGHMVFARNGKYIDLGAASYYPSTIIAETNDGNVMLIQNDGRQSGYSMGLRHNDCDQLAKELDLKNAFIVDGGGSSTMIALADNGYELVNRPCDKDSNGNYGATRTVVNSVILSYGEDRNAPEEKPTIEPGEHVSEPTQPTKDNGADNKPGKGWKIALIVGSVACLGIAVVLAVRAANKKFDK